MHVLNSRADLEGLRGANAFAAAIEALTGVFSIRIYAPDYPQGHG